MQHEYSTTQHPTVPAGNPEHPPVAGAWLSIVGLIAWLAAMALAVAGPLLSVEIPAPVIVGMVVFSGIFSLLSLPRLLDKGDDDDPD